MTISWNTLLHDPNNFLSKCNNVSSLTVSCHQRFEFGMHKRNIRRSSLVRDLMKCIQFKLWSTHQARWFGVSYPNLEQLDYFQEQQRIVQGMWNYCRRNWNCICTFISVQYLCMMVLYMLLVKSCSEFFWTGLMWQYWTGWEHPRSEPSWKSRGYYQNQSCRKTTFKYRSSEWDY